MVKVLVLEDEELVAEIIKDFIEGEFEVTFDNAKDGEEALELVKKNHYDLVIADYILPKMDGAKFARTLREQGIAESLPIVFVSGSIELCKESVEDLKHVSFIAKPWKVKELIQEVCEKLNKEK